MNNNVSIDPLTYVIHNILYFFQEILIFFPQKLKKTYQFQFDGKNEEQNIK